MLFHFIGLSAIATVGAMIAQYLYQVGAARFQYIYEKETLVAADDRLSLTTEIMQSIKTLKFLAWERGFVDRLQTKRMKELYAVRKRVAVGAMISLVTCEWSRS